jgi:hypothetical protein
MHARNPHCEVRLVSGRALPRLLRYRFTEVGPQFSKEVKRDTMALPVFTMALDMMMTRPGSARACAESGRLPLPTRLTRRACPHHH